MSDGSIAQQRARSMDSHAAIGRVKVASLRYRLLVVKTIIALV